MKGNRGVGVGVCEYWAEAIEAVFSLHRCLARVLKFHATPRFVHSNQSNQSNQSKHVKQKFISKQNATTKRAKT